MSSRRGRRRCSPSRSERRCGTRDGCRRSAAADLLAAVYAGIVLLYALIPQSWLDGEATTRGELLALRHHLTPVAAYALGRLLVLSARERRLLVWLAVAVGVAISLWGLADVYLVSLQWWRDSGVPGWYREQLGLDYKGLSGLPENWVYNTGDENNPLRRFVSTFLSPLATSYVLVVVLLLLAARRPTLWTVVAAAACYAGLLWTHTRAAVLALAVGLVVLAALQRRWPLVAVAAASLVVAVGFVKAYPTIGPSTSYTQSELAYLRAARETAGRNDRRPAVDRGILGFEPLAQPARRRRDRVPPPAGLRPRQHRRHSQAHRRRDQGGRESTYTELGVDAGLAGAAAFVAWCIALLLALRRRPGLAAAFAAVLFLALQSDVIGIHWLAFCFWAALGVGVSAVQREPAG